MTDSVRRFGALDCEDLGLNSDMRVRARGSSREEVYAAAAFGVMKYLFDESELKSVRAREHRDLVIEAGNAGVLLIDWLTELLAWSQTEGMAALEIEFADLSEELLRARVGVAPGSRVNDIRSVTFRDLIFHHERGAWLIECTCEI
jgi:SHS2 domain-containing protein